MLFGCICDPFGTFTGRGLEEESNNETKFSDSDGSNNGSNNNSKDNMSTVGESTVVNVVVSSANMGSGSGSGTGLGSSLSMMMEAQPKDKKSVPSVNASGHGLDLNGMPEVTRGESGGGGVHEAINGSGVGDGAGVGMISTGSSSSGSADGGSTGSMMMTAFTHHVSVMLGGEGGGNNSNNNNKEKNDSTAVLDPTLRSSHDSRYPPLPSFSPFPSFFPSPFSFPLYVFDFISVCAPHHSS